MFACFDDSSAVLAPEELGSRGSRIRFQKVGYDEDRRVHVLNQTRNRRLRLAAEDDAWDAPRDTLSFALGSGMTWVENGDVSAAAAKDGSVVVMYKGAFNVPDVHTEEDVHSAYVRGEDEARYQTPSNAQRMLDFYLWSDGLRLGGGDSARLDPTFTVEKLKQLSGGYAFVLYDLKRHRLVVARDGEGKQDLFWGVGADGADGSSLMFATDQASEVMDDCSPSATQFPRGAVLISQGGVAWRSKTKGLTCGPYNPGQSAIYSFARPEKPVRAVPRINSSGMLCGSVFRVESMGDLSNHLMPRAPSVPDIAAM